MIWVLERKFTKTKQSNRNQFAFSFVFVNMVCEKNRQNFLIWLMWWMCPNKCHFLCFTIFAFLFSFFSNFVHLITWLQFWVNCKVKPLLQTVTFNCWSCISLRVYFEAPTQIIVSNARYPNVYQMHARNSFKVVASQSHFNAQSNLSMTHAIHTLVSCSAWFWLSMKQQQRQ